MFEGKADLTASHTLRACIELVWHSALSCPAPLADEKQVSSVIEVELCPRVPSSGVQRALKIKKQGFQDCQRARRETLEVSDWLFRPLV